jgi:hypothetical protein
MQKYFRCLPPEAAQEIAFHELDNCQRETNIYSIYVGARLMWDPQQDAEVSLKEIARLVYGPKLEERVFNALKAIADVRCGAGACRGVWNPTQTTRTLVNADAGTSNGVVTFNEGYREAMDAWKGLKDAQIDSSYIAPLTFHRPAEVLLDELKGHSEAVATYMQYLKDKQEGTHEPSVVPKAKGVFEYYERMRYVDDQKSSVH